MMRVFKAVMLLIAYAMFLIALVIKQRNDILVIIGSGLLFSIIFDFLRNGADK